MMFAAGPAQAATLTVDRPCFRFSDPPADITLKGSGYTPGALVLLSSGNGTIGNAIAKPDGTISTKFPIPAPPDKGRYAHEKSLTFKAVEGDNTGEVTFSSAEVFGDYNPGSGNPATLKVRFSAFGFGIGTPAGQPMPTVFVHYVNPRGKLKQTISLGRGSGACGSIQKTSLRKLFPFKLTRGKWTLQFDTRKNYTPGKSTSSFLFDRGLTLTIS